MSDLRHLPPSCVSDLCSSPRPAALDFDLERETQERPDHRYAREDTDAAESGLTRTADFDRSTALRKSQPTPQRNVPGAFAGQGA